MNAAPLPFRQAHVLGAGLMGRLVALTLARAGCEVSVHDAGGPGADQAAARVAAAMLAPLAESAIAPPALVRMGLHSLARWPQLLALLPRPVFFQQAGTLIVWHRQDAAEAERLAGTLRRTQATVHGLAPMQALDAPALAALEPALAGRFMRGWWLPAEGQLDNRGLLDALRAALEADTRVTLHWHSPRSPDDFAPGPDARVIDCRGLGARAEWPQLRGVRGEVIRVHAPDVELHRPTRLVHPRYPLYIAPKPDHLFVIGATEIESQDLSPASVRSTMELLSAAYAVHPGFGEARIVEIATQCRPTLPDNLPAIRQTQPRVLEINGLYRHGFMIAPALLDVAMEVLNTGQSALASDFALSLSLPS